MKALIDIFVSKIIDCSGTDKQVSCRDVATVCVWSKSVASANNNETHITIKMPLIIVVRLLCRLCVKGYAFFQ